MFQKLSMDMFRSRAKNSPHDAAYYVRTASGSWQPTSWRSYYDVTANFAKGLIALGHQDEQCVCILGKSRPEWATACLATQMANGKSVGIYTSSSAEEVRYVVLHSESSFVVVENGDRFRNQIAPVLDELTNVRAFILLEPDNTITDKRVINFLEVVKRGKANDIHAIQERAKRIKPDGVCTLIYTSGTTGPPKAVMLSHANVAWTAQKAVQLFHVDATDRMVSYLPLAHIAEQMFSVYASVSSGMQIYFAESMDKLPDNLREVQPTIFFGVPRVYEKFFEKMRDKLNQLKGPKKWLITWARKVASAVWQLRHREQPVPTKLAIQYAVAQKCVFNKMKPLLGFGKARFGVSGAAPIAKEVLEFFLSLDIPIYEVYGQSEDCGPTSINVPGATRVGSAGRVLPGVQVKIAADGEILVKGPNVFVGYYKDESATAEALEDGWLHSGDIGQLDQDGFLRITDRKKDILITAGGKNVSPQNIEGLLKQIPLVSLAVVIGDRKKYLAALLTPNTEQLNAFAEQHGIVEADMGKLVTHKTVMHTIEQEIRSLNQQLAPVEQIKRFALLPVDFSIANGELTPTMKIKRKAINIRYEKEISQLYQET